LKFERAYQKMTLLFKLFFLFFYLTGISPYWIKRTVVCLGIFKKKKWSSL
jgi:hypothetical protein